MMWLSSDDSDLQVVMQEGAEHLAPKQAYAGDAGVDLATSRDYVLPAGFVGRLETGIVGIQFPTGVWGLIHTRSSTRERWGLEVRTSVIDTDYTGPIYIGVRAEREVSIPAGTRLAQIVMMLNVIDLMGMKTQVVDAIAERGERGNAGFGSSGE